jgi:hypothetical protein
LACAIRELPPGYRTIFLLHEVQGYDHQEIAQMLGCCTGNSESQLLKPSCEFASGWHIRRKPGPQPFELVDHAPNSQGHYLRRGLSIGRSVASSRRQAFFAIDSDEMAARVERNCQRQARRSTRFPWVIRANMK